MKKVIRCCSILGGEAYESALQKIDCLIVAAIRQSDTTE